MVADVTQLSEEDRDEFLGNSGTGVLSLSTASDESPHSLPVSYGYDPVESMFYFRVASGPDSEKGELAGRAVSFVTYDQVDGRWISVVAKGTLRETTDNSISLEALEGMERVHIPLVDIFGQPPGTVEFEFYQLDPDVLTSRSE